MQNMQLGHNTRVTRRKQIKYNHEAQLPKNLMSKEETEKISFFEKPMKKT